MIGTDLHLARKHLERGALVAVPTETVYGLAGNALKPESLAEIFRVKERPAFDPLIMHFASADELRPFVQALPEAFWPLYRRFSPGPLTFVLQKKPAVPDLLTAGQATVAVRFPAHPLSRELLQSLAFPLAAPSANKFGRVSPVRAEHVADQLGEEIPYILDGGPCSVGLESTIIDLSEKQPEILRLGGLPSEELENALGHPIRRKPHSSSNPKAPGMLSAHYSPGLPLLFGHLAENLPKVNRRRCGSITFYQAVPGIPRAQQRILSPRGDLREAASKLFEALRSLANLPAVEVILAEAFPEEGLGRAINDRLRRASVA